MKKSFSVLALIMFIITIWQINVTYAKFYAEAYSSNNINIGNWTIKVNEMDIYSENGESVAFTVDELNYGLSNNTVLGKLAPGREGYFDINIDPTGTDVAVRYDIHFDLSEFNSLNEENNKIMFGIEEISRNIQLIKTAEDTYSTVISLEDIVANKKDKIRFKAKWENDEANNEIDTEVASVYEREIDIPIEVTVSQYLGEELTPYVE